MAAGLNFATVQAEPAIYKEEVLMIPSGAVITTDDQSYFRDIRLVRESDGRFQVISASSRNLATVEVVEALILESFPVQVNLQVRGYKSLPCVGFEETAISQTGNRFDVVLAETKLGPAETCIAVIDPFETNIPLDVRGLSAGTYTVNVNGVESIFTLLVDNP